MLFRIDSIPRIVLVIIVLFGVDCSSGNWGHLCFWKLHLLRHGHTWDVMVIGQCWKLKRSSNFYCFIALLVVRLILYCCKVEYKCTIPSCNSMEVEKNKRTKSQNPVFGHTMQLLMPNGSCPKIWATSSPFSRILNKLYHPFIWAFKEQTIKNGKYLCDTNNNIALEWKCVC